MKSRIVMCVALVLWSFGSSACGKSDSVKFDAYEQSAVTMARGLEKPIVIYATADW